MSENILWEDLLHGGQAWSQVLEAGMAMRLTDIEGGANVSALFYNATHREERYNMPDTLKAQHIARLTKGFVLYSDMGRILCSVTDDTVGWHDPIGGTPAAAKEGLLLELAKYGLGPRDLTPTLNLFNKVQVDATGAMKIVPRNSKAGDYVELRAEMKVLVLLSANHKPAKLTVKRVPPPGPDDPCRVSRPENGRGFELTSRYCG